MGKSGTSKVAKAAKKRVNTSEVKGHDLTMKKLRSSNRQKLALLGETKSKQKTQNSAEIEVSQAGNVPDIDQGSSNNNAIPNLSTEADWQGNQYLFLDPSNPHSSGLVPNQVK